MFGWLKSLVAVSSDTARRRIVSGKAPRGMRVTGALRLADLQDLRSLPGNLRVERLEVVRCGGLKSLPPGLRCGNLTLNGLELEWLPPDLAVEGTLVATGCRRLRQLPWGLTTTSLVLRNCIALSELPESLRVRRLDIHGCTRVESLPAGLGETLTHLQAGGCTALKAIPDAFTRLIELDVSGCSELQEIPDGVRIRSWIDVAGSGLPGLPGSMRSTRVLWNGVPVTDRIAFDPGAIHADDVLNEPNQAVRRILLERMGLERFVDEAGAEVLDTDSDAGGERRLLEIQFDGGEPLRCVAVRCPSTGSRYVLRVPPTMRTCREAVAWTAGFTDPDKYHPVLET